jgi:phosphoserine phosphatase
MDSTLIDIETVDAIAEIAGCGTEVAAITEATMRGEITDYQESLRCRVALLRGVPLSTLQAVYDQRLHLNPGAETLIAACRGAGLRVILLSGGFTFFTDRLQDRLKLDDTRANVLEIEDGRLTGRLLAQPWGDICDGDAKRDKLLDCCRTMGISPAQAIAVGDGANDLPMMRVAGLSVAYRAKPAVREEAMLRIDEGGLDRLLELLKDARTDT